MNARHHLILANGQDKTTDIQYCKYNSNTGKYDVTYQGNKTYAYNYSSIEWIKDPEALDPVLVHIAHGEQELFNIQAIFVFRARCGDYWHICFNDGSERTYVKRDLKIAMSCLRETEAQNRLAYLRQLSAINELKSPDGEILLQKQYEKLDFVGQDTAMAPYLNPETHKPHVYSKGNLIFPFGGNASQFKAVEAALSNQISVIQGPPGTGKTQTILNILANLLATGKSALVVSNNNSATENIREKLASPKYGLDFLSAPLGKSENKAAFIASQIGRYPDLSTWAMDAQRQAEIRQKTQTLSTQLSEIFSKQEILATVRAELTSLLTEIHYFEEYCEETGHSNLRINPKHKLKSAKLMQLWQECYAFSEKKRSVSLWFKIKSVFFYGISDWNFYSNDLSFIISLLQGLFYHTRKEDLEQEIAELEATLAQAHAQEKMDELTRFSMDLLRARLFTRYGNHATRELFSEEDLWKRASVVSAEYPIVLSTTFSSRVCLKNVVYDYLIMDEASQVDVATGALALSCAKNAVIVGDLKQLPNVVSREMKVRSDAVFASFHLPQGYSYSENSFLKSICSILPDVPQTLLREHYRCHPKIIGFCNEKFYNNELLIMTQDCGEPDTLTLIETNQGNHRRDRINQRQIDAMVCDVLPLLRSVPPEKIGIVAPYRDQVTEIEKQLGDNKIEVHTVHKFQGREKDTIVLTTVDDVVTDFSDDPYLLNVAVSRAKKQLLLVASGNDQPADSNIGDLISYIRYNNYQVIQSEIYSVFDLLYQQYTEARIAYLKKHLHVSEYNSENLMYGAVCDLLKERPQLSLSVICHQPLNMLIRDPHLLNEEECRYAMNTATHLDFLIYNRISKLSVLAIEVDGFHFHKPGTAQYERDRLKDHILKLYGIPMLRLATNGSGEIEKIATFLDGYMDCRY
ncbi:AAA domain-containing protein [Anaerotruncus rubiinfantis]|uniref:AAA domain-containing protein n=1 Tax=Anaerotruncus rubiinfantis TaxID=1720200 RepID=UPI001899A5EC